MSDNNKKWFTLDLNSKHKQTTNWKLVGCGKTSGGCGSHSEEKISEPRVF